MYEAKIDIGGFKKGDIVPDEKAKIWSKQYIESPVEFICKPEPKVIVVKKDNGMLDDYLNRNESVVLKNLKGDKISKEDVEKMIDIEKSNKKRAKVIKALYKK